MKRTVVLVLLSLHCLSLTSCASGCHEDGPEDCSFYKSYYKNTFCSWSQGDHFKFYDDGSGHYYCAGLRRGAGEGKLTSRMACSTQGEEHCLQFQYRFEQNNVIDLSVSIRYETEEPESLLWMMYSSTVWNNAVVPVNNTKNFNVVFKATRRHGHFLTPSTVLIDDIDYSNSPCQSGRLPHDAQPTTTTPTTPMNATPTSRITLPAESRNTTAAMIMLTSSNNFEEKHSVEQRNAGIIVGVIVAVLIIIVISVLLFVFRRKHVHVWKACCRKKQPEEQSRMNASHNVTSNLDVDDPGHVTGALANNTQQNSDNHRLEGRTFTHSLANQCYERTQPNNAPEHVYAAYYKHREVEQENSPNAPGQDEDYNRLNFDTKSCHEETNGVYSHLNEGNGDTYNEVHREKRDEVIGGVYSHIK